MREETIRIIDGSEISELVQTLLPDLPPFEHNSNDVWLLGDWLDSDWDGYAYNKECDTFRVGLRSVSPPYSDAELREALTEPNAGWEEVRRLLETLHAKGLLQEGYYLVWLNE